MDFGFHGAVRNIKSSNLSFFGLGKNTKLPLSFRFRNGVLKSKFPFTFHIPEEEILHWPFDHPHDKAIDWNLSTLVYIANVLPHCVAEPDSIRSPNASSQITGSWASSLIQKVILNPPCHFCITAISYSKCSMDFYPCLEFSSTEAI